MSEWVFNRFGPKSTDPKGFGRIMRSVSPLGHNGPFNGRDSLTAEFRMSQEAVGKRFSEKGDSEAGHDMLV